jgi:hypothetical protein
VAKGDLVQVPGAAELDRIERELDVCREEIEDLRRRTRVIEVETRSWVPQQPLVRPMPRGGGLGFLIGLTGMWLLELLLLAIGSMR